MRLRLASPNGAAEAGDEVGGMGNQFDPASSPVLIVATVVITGIGIWPSIARAGWIGADWIPAGAVEGVGKRADRTRFADRCMCA